MREPAEIQTQPRMLGSSSGGNSANAPLQHAGILALVMSHRQKVRAGQNSTEIKFSNSMHSTLARLARPIGAAVSLAVLSFSGCSNPPAPSSPGQLVNGWEIITAPVQRFDPGTIYSVSAAGPADARIIEQVLKLKGPDISDNTSIPEMQQTLSVGALANLTEAKLSVGVDANLSANVHIRYRNTLRKWRPFSDMDGALAAAKLDYKPGRIYYVVLESLSAGTAEYEVTSSANAQTNLDALATALRVGTQGRTKNSVVLKTSFPTRLVVGIKSRRLN